VQSSISSPVGLPDNQVRSNNFLAKRRVVEYRPEPGLRLLMVIGAGLPGLRLGLAGT
jgi:hypothetical protein